jgi:hypothetical protein
VQKLAENRDLSSDVAHEVDRTDYLVTNSSLTSSAGRAAEHETVIYPFLIMRHLLLLRNLFLHLGSLLLLKTLGLAALRCCAVVESAAHGCLHCW